MKISIALLAVTWIASAAEMPVAQQNALIQKYCAVCHTDARPNGGLSLQHFDAAHADPADAAMVLSKVLGGALGAAGLPAPDDATVDAWTSALKAEAVGADQWTLKRTANAVTASIVRAVPTAEQPDLYRLTLTCRNSREAEVQLAWAPGVPKSGQEFAVIPDKRVAKMYKVEGTETMGNGTSGTSGSGSILLYKQSSVVQIPADSLLIRDLFPQEKVSFPFAELTKENRVALSACFL
ncbi:MAG: hypothetical protein ABIR70_05410 [Bryobacteraceae bacterium]